MKKSSSFLAFTDWHNVALLIFTYISNKDKVLLQRHYIFRYIVFEELCCQKSDTNEMAESKYINSSF